MADKVRKIDSELLDELLQGREPRTVLSSEVLLGVTSHRQKHRSVGTIMTDGRRS